MSYKNILEKVLVKSVAQQFYTQFIEWYSNKWR